MRLVKGRRQQHDIPSLGKSNELTTAEISGNARVGEGLDSSQVEALERVIAYSRGMPTALVEGSDH